MIDVKRSLYLTFQNLFLKTFHKMLDFLSSTKLGNVSPQKAVIMFALIRLFNNIFAYLSEFFHS